MCNGSKARVPHEADTCCWCAHLADATLTAVFAERHRTYRLEWPAAYPVLLPTPPQSTWPPFDVPLGSNARAAEPRVFYVGAMESAVSCMETQLIAAKNAALRIARLLE